MKNIILILKLMAISFGPLCIIFAEKLFNKYFLSGKIIPDESYHILINNHGTYRYITEHQNNNIRIAFALIAIWIFFLLTFIILLKFKK